jgi:hypothetical protein
VPVAVRIGGKAVNPAIFLLRQLRTATHMGG